MSTFPFPNSSRTASPVRNKPFREHKNNGPISIFKNCYWAPRLFEGGWGGGGGEGGGEIKQKKKGLFMVSLNIIYFVLFPQASEPNIISLGSVLFWKNDFCRN